MPQLSTSTHRVSPAIRLAFALGAIAAVAECAVALPRLSDEDVVLPDPTPDPIGSIGSSVILTPDWVVVGAREKRFLEPTRILHSYGALLLWPRTLAGRPEGAPLTVWPLLPVRSARFGACMDADGDRLLVGEPGHRPTSNGPRAVGRAQIVDLALDPPAATEIISSPVTQSGLEFGTAVSLASPFALIGAPGFRAAGGATPYGAAMLFERSEDGGGGTGSWTLLRTLLAPEISRGVPGGAYARFGSAVALHSSETLIGAPSGVILPDLGYGRVYVYALSDGALVKTLTAPEPTLGDRFGTSMALAGDLLAVAAPGDECGLGSVHLFRRSAEGAWNVEATLEAPTVVDGIDVSEGWIGFGNALAIDRERVIVGTGGFASETNYGHRAAIFRRAGAIGESSSWVLEATIDADPSQPTGSPVAIDPRGAVVGESSIDFGQMRFVASDRSLDLALDLDFDGLVGAGDLAVLLGGWGSGAGSPADLNGDGSVDQADLAILLGGWS